MMCVCVFPISTCLNSQPTYSFVFGLLLVPLPESLESLEFQVDHAWPWSLAPQTLVGIQMLEMAPSSASIFGEISEVEAANNFFSPQLVFLKFPGRPFQWGFRSPKRSWVLGPSHPHLWLFSDGITTRGLWIEVSNPNIIPYLPSYCPILSSQSVKKLWNGRYIQKK